MRTHNTIAHLSDPHIDQTPTRPVIDRTAAPSLAIHTVQDDGHTRTTFHCAQ